MIERFLTIGPNGRVLALFVLVVVSFAAALALPDLKVDRSDDKLISHDDPGWNDFNQMQADFGDEQTVLIYLRSKDLWTSARLRELREVAFALEDTPEITAVSSLLSATNIRDKGDYVEAGPLIDVIPDSVERLAEKRADALYSPIMLRNVISADAEATVISLGYVSNPDDPNHELRIFDLIEQRTLRRSETPDPDFARHTGRHHHAVLEVGKGRAGAPGDLRYQPAMDVRVHGRGRDPADVAEGNDPGVDHRRRLGRGRPPDGVVSRGY